MYNTIRPHVAAAGLALVIGDSIVAQQVLFSVAPGGPSGLASEFVYANIGGVPTPVAGGPSSGLFPGDVNNGFSFNKFPLKDFLICFSVDPASVGGPLPPVPGFPPFNVTDQAWKNQAAGDAFISTAAYNRFAGLLPAPTSMGLLNNVLVINQSPAYAADFALMPTAGPGTSLDAGTRLDDIGGGGGGPVGGLANLYFTLAPGNSGGFSGADIIFDPTPNFPGGPGEDESMFAAAGQLGLMPFDVLDALAVFDDGLSKTFDAADTVLFSLAPGSPSLGLFGASPADILSVTFGGLPSLFALHTDLNLLASDNINMLELVPLLDTAEATITAKLPAPGTLPLLALGGLMARRRRR